MKQRVWFVSEVYHPENEGAGYYISEISFATAREASVFALCTPPTYSHKGMSVPKHETHQGVKMCRCFSAGWNRHKMSGRLVNAATFCMSVFFHLLFRMKKGDIVVSTCYPPPVSFATILAAKLRRGKHVVYVMDIHPDIAVAAGMFKKSSIAVRIANRVNHWIYRSSTKIIVIGRDMKTYVAEKFSVPLNHIDSIPLFVDTEEIHPTPRSENNLLNENDLADKFVIGIAGNIGAAHDADLLLEAARQTSDLIDLRFMAIGSGKRFNWLREEVEKAGLDNFAFVDRLPRSEACRIANACDVAISALYIPGLFGLACPSRTGSIFAAGKPVIALIDPKTELANDIESNDVGWRITPGDTAGFVHAIREAYDVCHKPDEADALSQRARRLAVEEMGKEIVLTKYVKSILSSGGHKEKVSS